MDRIEITTDKDVCKEDTFNTKILIFTEGTIIGPRSLFQHFNHATYVPIGNSNERTFDWYKQGAEIIYLTSRKIRLQVENIADILEVYNFAPGVLVSRTGNETYRDIVECIEPDILIEDDCRSIGGKWQMCITYVKPELKRRIKSIVVKEFQGIGHLPERVQSL